MRSDDRVTHPNFVAKISSPISLSLSPSPCRCSCRFSHTTYYSYGVIDSPCLCFCFLFFVMECVNHDMFLCWVCFTAPQMGSCLPMLSSSGNLRNVEVDNWLSGSCIRIYWISPVLVLYSWVPEMCDFVWIGFGVRLLGSDFLRKYSSLLTTVF